MSTTADKPHVYDANLDDSSALQDFFEDSNLVVATRFFRHKELFRQLQGVVIPRLLRGSLPRRRVLRIWSAGCSDGRETYSLAMAARQALDGRGHQLIRISVRGSDLSRPQLEIARKGVYEFKAGVSRTLEPYTEFFEPAGDRTLRVKASLREMVDFMVEDITKVKPDEPYDVLVCSLVLLYYEPEYRKRIVQHLMTTLRADGFLHVASVNRRWMKSQGFFPVDKSGHFFCRDGSNRSSAKMVSPKNITGD